MKEYFGIKLGPVNEKIFPLAYQLLCSENVTSYEVFCDKYRRILASENNRLVCFGYEDKIIGFGEIGSIDTINRYAQIALFLIAGEEEHFKSCICALIKMGFYQLNLNSLSILTKSNNPGNSITDSLTNHLAILPERIYEDGKYTNMETRTILRSEWKF